MRQSQHQQLFTAMADELRVPLLQVARQAELAQSPGIEASATQALWLVDSYLLSQQLPLELEPVAVSAALDDAAQALDNLAKQYNCKLELQLSGRYSPVLAHPRGLHTALVGLGSSLMAATPADGQQLTVVLGAHKGTSGGVVTGIYTANDNLSQAVYRQGRALYGRARQPLHQLTAQPGAGIFIADSLFNSMAARLRFARHHKLNGLAATLPASRQLALV